MTDSPTSQAMHLAMTELKEREQRIAELTDALLEIALAGMSGTGQESEEAMRAFHARQAWNFIAIAARALTKEKARA